MLQTIKTTFGNAVGYHTVGHECVLSVRCRRIVVVVVLLLTESERKRRDIEREREIERD